MRFYGCRARSRIIYKFSPLKTVGEEEDVRTIYIQDGNDDPELLDGGIRKKEGE